MTRPIQLTPAVCDAVVAGVKAGLRPIDAMIRVGIPPRTASDYTRAMHEGDQSTYWPASVKLQKILIALGERCRAAEFEQRMALLKNIEGHGQKSWQASAWILERVHGFVKPPDLVVHTVGRDQAEEQLDGALQRRAKVKPQIRRMEPVDPDGDEG